MFGSFYNGTDIIGFTFIGEMKEVFFLCLTLLSVNSFQLYHTPRLISSENLLIQNLKACTSSQINAVYSAISVAQTADINASITNIMRYYLNTTQQQWNFFGKNSTTNPDVVVFWYFNQCYVNLNNYGRYNRVYIAWQSESYVSNSQTKQLSSSQEKSESSQLQNLKQQCEQYRLTAVKNAVYYCDIPGNSNAAECIANKIKDQLGELWNVYVGTTPNSAFSMWNYGGCVVKYTSYGIYQRYIYIVWAYPY